MQESCSKAKLALRQLVGQPLDSRRLLAELTCTGPWLMVGAGYESDSSDTDTTETGDEVESTQGFVLQDDDGGDKFVVKVGCSCISTREWELTCDPLLDCKRPYVQHVCLYHNRWQLQVSTRTQYLRS
jgi:hypothetical protein